MEKEIENLQEKVKTKERIVLTIDELWDTKESGDTNFVDKLVSTTNGKQYTVRARINLTTIELLTIVDTCLDRFYFADENNNGETKYSKYNFISLDGNIIKAIYFILTNIDVSNLDGEELLALTLKSNSVWHEYGEEFIRIYKRIKDIIIGIHENNQKDATQDLYKYIKEKINLVSELSDGFNFDNFNFKKLGLSDDKIKKISQELIGVIQKEIIDNKMK